MVNVYHKINNNNNTHISLYTQPDYVHQETSDFYDYYYTYILFFLETTEKSTAVGRKSRQPPAWAKIIY